MAPFEMPEDDLDLGRYPTVHLVCATPIDHALAYRRLGQIAERLRGRAPAQRRVLHLRSHLADDEPFAALPFDRVTRLPTHGDAAIVAAADGAGRSPDEASLILTTPAADALAERLRGALGRGLAATLSLGFSPIPPPSPELADAERVFQTALARAPTRWCTADNAPAPPATPRRLLVHQARFHVGDALWLVPLLRALRRRWPRCHIAVVTPPATLPLLTGSPAVDDLVSYPEDATDADRKRVLRAIDRPLRDAAIFAFARRAESRWLLEAVAARGVPWRLNLEYYDPELDPRRRQKATTHEGWCFWNGRPSPATLLDLLTPLGLPADAGDDPRPTLPPLPYGAARRARAGHSVDGPYAVLAPGGRSSTRWGEARFAELAARLTRRYSLAILIEGAPEERALLERVAGRARALGAPPAAIVVGTEPLPVFAALLARARLLIANDSAPTHLAAAAGTPTLYLAQQEKRIHSDPQSAVSRALYDDVANDLRSIAVERVLAEIAAMVAAGMVDVRV